MLYNITKGELWAIRSKLESHQEGAEEELSIVRGLLDGPSIPVPDGAPEDDEYEELLP